MSILITGATSGIGEELARQLQGRGKLLLTGRNEVKLHQLKQTLQGEVETLACDLSKSTEPLLNWIERERPQLIFNNAGFGLYGPFDSLSEKEMEEMMQVNCVALTEITHKAISLWKREKIEGTVLNISSMASFVPFPTGALYAATKAFVTHLSFSLDMECRSRGIRILASCPGMVDTEFSKRASRGKNGVARSFSEKFVMMDSTHVVKKILRQLDKKTPIQVIDGRYQFLHLIYRITPVALVGKLISWNLKKRL
jgi:Short-chain dehydrogenases of various substrate specificities